MPDYGEFLYLCGRIASKYETAMAHAMLHAVASRMAQGGIEEPPGGLAATGVGCACPTWANG